MSRSIKRLDKPVDSGYSSLMKRVSVTDLKNGLSHYLRLVKRGETIEVMEHQVPIARLVRLEAGVDEDPQLERLVRDGIVTLGARDPGTVKLRPPIECPVDIVRILLEERGGE
ncbi:MAG TPA: hypothetical protein VF720_05000 [Candidatus Eisenbacteria bacterium]